MDIKVKIWNQPYTSFDKKKQYSKLKSDKFLRTLKS